MLSCDSVRMFILASIAAFEVASVWIRSNI